MSRRILRLGNLSRDIPQLLRQLNHLRTWGYIAHRSDWLDDAEHWRGQVSVLEEKLSETLHQRLTQRFIDDLSSAVVERPHPEGVHLLSIPFGQPKCAWGGWLVFLQSNPLANACLAAVSSANLALNVVNQLPSNWPVRCLTVLPLLLVKISVLSSVVSSLHAKKGGSLISRCCILSRFHCCPNVNSVAFKKKYASDSLEIENSELLAPCPRWSA